MCEPGPRSRARPARHACGGDRGASPGVEPLQALETASLHGARDRGISQLLATFAVQFDQLWALAPDRDERRVGKTAAIREIQRK